MEYSNLHCQGVAHVHYYSIILIHMMYITKVDTKYTIPSPATCTSLWQLCTRCSNYTKFGDHSFLFIFFKKKNTKLVINGKSYIVDIRYYSRTISKCLY